MDVIDGKQESVHREADQVELMEDGQNQSDTQRRESTPQLGPSAVTQVQYSPPHPNGKLKTHVYFVSSCLQPSDILYNAVLKVRGQTSRKRQHQAAERGQNNDKLQI